jgi:hypothetical protein
MIEKFMLTTSLHTTLMLCYGETMPNNFLYDL